MLVTKGLFRTCGDRTLLQKPWSFSFSERFMSLVSSLTDTPSLTYSLAVHFFKTYSFSVCFLPGVKLAGLRMQEVIGPGFYSLQSYSPLRMYFGPEAGIVEVVLLCIISVFFVFL